jgi:hypothetical protein
LADALPAFKRSKKSFEERKLDTTNPHIPEAAGNTALIFTAIFVDVKPPSQKTAADSKSGFLPGAKGNTQPCPQGAVPGTGSRLRCLDGDSAC